MKRVTLLVLMSLLLYDFSFAQDHISFNGATYGQKKSEFESSFIGHPSESYLLLHDNKSLYNRYFYPDISLSNYQCKMFLHSSLKTNIVFETVVWFFTSDLKGTLQLFVKVFEEKYGGHYEASQDELGYIQDGYANSTSSDGHGYHYYSLHNTLLGIRPKEMLALKYIVRSKRDNKAIGEIRISAAPSGPNVDHGLIEITYRDYAAADTAIKECDDLMKSIL